MNTPADGEEELEDFLEELYRFREAFGALSGADRQRDNEERWRRQYTSGHKVFTTDPNDRTRLICIFDPAVDVEPRDIHWAVSPPAGARKADSP